MVQAFSAPANGTVMAVLVMKSRGLELQIPGCQPISLGQQATLDATLGSIHIWSTGPNGHGYGQRICIGDGHVVDELIELINGGDTA